ncbi:MAG: HTH domain-containing protein [Chloroflexota bacterium]
MNRLERLYAISDHLRRHAPAALSAQSLASRFDVSRRTIERVWQR